MNKNLTAFVGAKISEFKAKMAEVSKIMHTTATGNRIDIDGNIRPVTTKIAEVKAELKSIRDKTVEIHAKVDKRWDKFGDDLDSLATRIRTFGTVGQSVISGFALSISSAGVPAIASLVAGIGSLGPILGVAAGGAAALGTSFAMAGAGIGAFSAVASANLGDMFEKMKKMSDLQSKIDMTKDLKERNKLLQQQKTILDSMDKPEQRAYEASQKLKQVWQGITDPLKSQTVSIYTKALSALSDVLIMLKPTFQGVTQAVENLVNSLNEGLKSSDAINFFKVLGQTIGPNLETMGKAGMNFLLGMMNLFTAFVPLGQKMSNGLLGMSQSFLKWTETVGKSKAFQNFINYVTTNGPKLLKIVGNLSLGIVGMFSAFGSTSADMMTSLVSMTNSFKTWGQTLGQNKQFQQFIGYVKQNAPAVISVIGNVVQIIGALAVGFAPVGAAVLKFLVPFTQMIGSFLKAHPIIASIIAVIVSVIGVFVALAPTIMAVTSVIGVLITVVGAIAGAVGGFLAFLVSWPVLLAAAGALLVAIIINNWDSIWSFLKGLWSTIVSAGASLWNGFVSMMSGVWSAITSATSAAWNGIKSFLSGLWNGIKSVASTVWNTLGSYFTAELNAYKTVFTAVWNTIKSVLSAVWTGIKAVASVVWGAIKAYFIGELNAYKTLFSAAWNVIKTVVVAVWNGIKVAASSIWNGIKSVIIAVASALQSGLSSAWNAIRSAASAVWGAIRGVASSVWGGIKSTVIGLVDGMRSGISSAWNAIKSATSSAFRAVVGFIKNPLQAINLFSIGKNIIQGLINGIGSLASAVGSKIMSIAGNIKGKIQSALGIHSPSRFMAWVGEMTGQGLVNGIAGMQSKVASASQGMAQAAQIAPQQTDFSYSSQLSTSGLDSVQQEVTASMEQTELSKRPAIINLQVGSKTLAKAVIDDINKLQDKQVNQRAVFG